MLLLLLLSGFSRVRLCVWPHRQQPTRLLCPWDSPNKNTGGRILEWVAISFSNYRGLECKTRTSRSTWSNRQIWPCSTEWSRAKAKKFCQENALVIANTLFQQHKKTSPHGQHQNQINYILCSQKQRSCIQSAKTRLGAHCGSDHELLIAKFRLKLK